MPQSNQAYTNQLLKVVVAQICQTIGFNSIQSTPMEVMTDVLHNYIRELCVLTKDYAEHYNRTEPNLEDVTLAYREMKINFNELREYMEYVDPIPFALAVPKYPLPKESHLNFLKPGSQEVLTRPMHIPEYMPPMQPEPEEEQQVANTDENSAVEEQSGAIKDELMLSPTALNPPQSAFPFKKPPDLPMPAALGASEAQRHLKFDGGLKETREISSVFMTTSGFISPSREGKLPDSKPPIIIPDKRPSPPPQPIPVAPLSVSQMDNKFEEKPTKKKGHETEKKEKKKIKKELFHPPTAPPVMHQAPSQVAEPPIRQVPVAAMPSANIPPQMQQRPQFPFASEDIKPPTQLATPPSGPRKPGRPRKSESLTPGAGPIPADKIKKPKNPDAKLIKQIKKQVAAGILPALPIQELLAHVKAQNPQVQAPQQRFMPGSSMSNPQISPSGGANLPFSPPKIMPGQHFEGKVTSESEKSKLNIFKKMPSSSKMVHHDFPMMKSEVFPHSSEVSPQKKQFRPEFDFPTTPVNMMNKSMEFNRSPIEDLTMPTTPQYMPRTPDVKGSGGWKPGKEEKKKKEKPEKKIKKIKTPPLMPFFNPGPDMPLNRMQIPGMPFPQMPGSSMQQTPQQQQQQQQSRFPFFPNLIPSGPGLIPNNAFLPGFGNPAQFGAPPFNIPNLFPNDILQSFNKIRTQLDQHQQHQQQASTSAPMKDKFQEQLMEMKQSQCNVPSLLPPTVLDAPLKMRADSPPSLMRLPKDTVAIPIEQQDLAGPSRKMTVEKLDEISVKTEYKPAPVAVEAPVNFDTVDLTSPSDLNKDEKESKKDKKLKKEKKKKKDKIKDKDGSIVKDKSERKKDKEERKREKKEKRREKERLAMEQNKFLSSNTDSIDNSDSSLASVPKLTLKLGVSGDSRPNTPDIPKKMTIKSTFKKDPEVGSPLQMTISSSQRESSPELAKFSALVTHPPKQKSSHKRKHDDDVFSGDESRKHLKSPGGSGGESKKHKKTTPTPSTSLAPSEGMKLAKEEDGQQIWICPACGQVDNGTPMIGCDGCDAWYHWVCVGITVPPDVNEDWYCRVCISRKQDSHGSEKKKKRKKNKEKGEKI
ncbi:transcription initiation factor TFIID subunit 3 [Culicoides brevitarsis]|uniref:transcription initiation factor TFIID subunit 3 n=1 Tax=Culicoides brevitarsis TaxID=469753 RepID=UPI00307B295C